MNLTLLIFASRLAWQAALKILKLGFSVNTDLLIMVEKGIRDGISHPVHQYTETNNKYMKYYDKNKKSLYLNH